MEVQRVIHCVGRVVEDVRLAGVERAHHGIEHELPVHHTHGDTGLGDRVSVGVQSADRWLGQKQAVGHQVGTRRERVRSRGQMHQHEFVLTLVRDLAPPGRFVLPPCGCVPFYEGDDRGVHVVHRVHSTFGHQLRAQVGDLALTGGVPDPVRERDQTVLLQLHRHVARLAAPHEVPLQVSVRVVGVRVDGRLTRSGSRVNLTDPEPRFIAIRRTVHVARTARHEMVIRPVQRAAVRGGLRGQVLDRVHVVEHHHLAVRALLVVG